MGLKYLMVVLACFWLMLSIRLQVEVVNFSDGFLLPVLRQVPELILTEDRLTMNVPSPHEVKDPRTGKTLLIFDTRADAQEPSLDLDGIFYIGDKQILHYHGQKSEFELKGSWKKPLITAEMLKSLEEAKDWSGIIVFSVFYLATLFFVTLQVFLYGLVGFAMSGVLRRPLSFSQAGRVAAIALLPVLTLEFLQRITGVFLPLWTMVSVFLAIGYVIFGIRSTSIKLNRPELLDSAEVSAKNR